MGVPRTVRWATPVRSPDGTGARSAGGASVRVSGVSSPGGGGVWSADGGGGSPVCASRMVARIASAASMSRTAIRAGVVGVVSPAANWVWPSGVTVMVGPCAQVPRSRTVVPRSAERPKVTRARVLAVAVSAWVIRSSGGRASSSGACSSRVSRSVSWCSSRIRARCSRWVSRTFSAWSRVSVRCSRGQPVMVSACSANRAVRVGRSMMTSGVLVGFAGLPCGQGGDQGGACGAGGCVAGESEAAGWEPVGHRVRAGAVVSTVVRWSCWSMVATGAGSSRRGSTVPGW